MVWKKASADQYHLDTRNGSKDQWKLEANFRVTRMRTTFGALKQGDTFRFSKDEVPEILKDEPIETVYYKSGTCMKDAKRPSFIAGIDEGRIVIPVAPVSIPWNDLKVLQKFRFVKLIPNMPSSTNTEAWFYRANDRFYCNPAIKHSRYLMSDPMLEVVPGEIQTMPEGLTAFSELQVGERFEFDQMHMPAERCTGLKYTKIDETTFSFITDEVDQRHQIHPDNPIIRRLLPYDDLKVGQQFRFLGAEGASDIHTRITKGRYLKAEGTHHYADKEKLTIPLGFAKPPVGSVYFKNLEFGQHFYFHDNFLPEGCSSKKMAYARLADMVFCEANKPENILNAEPHHFVTPAPTFETLRILQRFKFIGDHSEEIYIKVSDGDFTVSGKSTVHRVDGKLQKNGIIPLDMAPMPEGLVTFDSLAYGDYFEFDPLYLPHTGKLDVRMVKHDSKGYRLDAGGDNTPIPLNPSQPVKAVGIPFGDLPNYHKFKFLKRTTPSYITEGTLCTKTATGIYYFPNKRSTFVSEPDTLVVDLGRSNIPDAAVLLPFVPKGIAFKFIPGIPMHDLCPDSVYEKVQDRTFRLYGSNGPELAAVSSFPVLLQGAMVAFGNLKVREHFKMRADDTITYVKNTMDTGCQIGTDNDTRAFESGQAVFPLGVMEPILHGAVTFSSLPKGTTFQFKAPYVPYGRGVNSCYTKEDDEKIQYAGKTTATKMSGDYPVLVVNKVERARPLTFGDLRRFARFEVTDASTKVPFRKITDTAYILDGLNGEPTVYVMAATTLVAVLKEDSPNGKVIV
jgi:hypothetical protein